MILQSVITDRIMRTTSLVMILVALVATWWSFIDGSVVNPPIVYWSGSFGIQDGTYRPGDVALIRLAATKHRDIRGRVHWTMVREGAQGSNYAIHFEPRSASLGIGYNDVIIPVLTIPANCPPGRYHLHGYAEYSVNPIRTVTFPMTSNSFEVVP
jgi:hypothetical protein